MLMINTINLFRYSDCARHSAAKCTHRACAARACSHDKMNFVLPLVLSVVALASCVDVAAPRECTFYLIDPELDEADKEGWRGGKHTKQGSKKSFKFDLFDFSEQDLTWNGTTIHLIAKRPEKGSASWVAGVVGNRTHKKEKFAVIFFCCCRRCCCFVGEIHSNVVVLYSVVRSCACRKRILFFSI
jgi:hypothetical protein